MRGTGTREGKWKKIEGRYTRGKKEGGGAARRKVGKVTR